MVVEGDVLAMGDPDGDKSEGLVAQLKCAGHTTGISLVFVDAPYGTGRGRWDKKGWTNKDFAQVFEVCLQFRSTIMFLPRRNMFLEMFIAVGGPVLQARRRKAGHPDLPRETRCTVRLHPGSKACAAQRQCPGLGQDLHGRFASRLAKLHTRECGAGVDKGANHF